MFYYFWDRERQHEQGRSRERGRHRIWSRLRALSCQHRAWRGARTQQVGAAVGRSTTEPPRRPPTTNFQHVLPEINQAVDILCHFARVWQMCRKNTSWGSCPVKGCVRLQCWWRLPQSLWWHLISFTFPQKCTRTACFLNTFTNTAWY